MRFETKAIQSGFNQDSKTGATAVPIFQTASFAYPSSQDLADVFDGRKFGHLYSRISNPTVFAFESRVNDLEGGLAAVAVASGMAAIASVAYALTQQGDEIIASTSLFGGTLHFFEDLEKFGIKTRYVDMLNLEALESAITDKTKFVFFETIGNPKMDVPQVRAIVEIAQKANVPVVVDSTLTSPYLFQAKQYGVAIAVHSATKYIGIGGTTLGGVLVDLGTFKWKESRSEDIRDLSKKAGPFGFIAKVRQHVVTNSGNILAPFNAFMLNLGLETLSIRLEKQCANALALATFLQQQSQVLAVGYPGLASHPQHEIAKVQFNGKFGALLTFNLDSKASCFSFMDRLKWVKNMTSLGDSKTMVIHPESTIFHSCSPSQMAAAGVSDTLIRVSVGLEHSEDIQEDFKQALFGTGR